MRPFAQILVTVALVACGILVYDTLRGPSAPDGLGVGGEGGEVARLADRVARLEERPAATLVGSTPEDLMDRLVALERRLEDLPVVTASGRAAGGGEGEGPSAGGGGSPSYDDGSVPSGEATFDERELADFRARLEVVERRRREEDQANGVRAQLQALDLRLTPDQEKLVVAETLKLREKTREIWRGGFRDEVSRQSNMTKMQEARDAWAGAVQAALAPSDAEKVIAALGRGPWGGSVGVGRPGEAYGPRGAGASPSSPR